MEFIFSNEYPASRLDEVIAFMMGPRLWIPHTDYPDFLAWADRAHRDLRRESKRAMLALNHGAVIGVAVYQHHKTLADTLEIKNLTVRPDMRGRYIASFLMRNAEIEGARETRAASVMCDAKADNLPVHYFLSRLGYHVAARRDLYALKSGDDLVYTKRLSVPTA